MKKFSEKLALSITLLLSRWITIIGINVFMVGFIYYKDLLNNNALEVFNLILSVSALSLEFIILNSTLNLGNMDRAKLNNILRKDSEILKEIKGKKDERDSAKR